MSWQGAHKPRKFEVSERILALRSRTKLTQGELAELIGVSRRSVQAWEAGAAYPQEEKLQRLIGLFLTQGVLTPRQELEEAYDLWQQVDQDAPRRIARFDEAWFAALLAGYTTQAAVPDEAPPTPPDAQLEVAPEVAEGAEQATTPATVNSPASHPPLLSLPPRTLTVIDWGEAPDVPVLYGREAELATLYQYVVEDHCRVVALLGLGGMGKTSLATTFVRRLATNFEQSGFDVLLFRSLKNGPPLAQLLDQLIRAISSQQALLPDSLPELLADKVTHLVQLLRQQRCLLILDNFETLLQPGTLTGTYRPEHEEYAQLLSALAERDHKSCLLLTSREKPSELGPLVGRSTPVRTLQVSGLPDDAGQLVLEAKELVGTDADLQALVRVYGGNPLALNLVSEPIHAIFGSDVASFLETDDAFFNGMSKLLDQQFTRLTLLEQSILYQLAIARELVPLQELVATVGGRVPHREVLGALESLSRRMLVERTPDRPAFTLQPVVLEYTTERLVELIYGEVVEGQPNLLARHPIVQATAKEYIRLSQERMIARPLLERLIATYADQAAVSQQLSQLLSQWRQRPPLEQGYGPGNVVNLLRLLRQELRHIDLTRLAIRHAFLQGVEMQDSNLANALLQESVTTEAFDALTAVAISSSGEYWAAASRRGEVLVWSEGGVTLLRTWRAHTDMIWTLTFSPDGRTLATGSWDGRVKLWDIASGVLRWSGEHASLVKCVAFSPDGTMLASSGNDGTVWLWELQSHTQLQSLAHTDPVLVITWSPDGRLLVTGDSEGSIRIWEIETPTSARCVQTIVADTNWVDGVAFAPDGSMLASVGWDGIVKLWEVPSGRLRQAFSGHTNWVLRVAWSPDGRTVATCSHDQTIRLWDVEQGSASLVLQGHSAGVNGVAFTPDGRSLFSGGEDGMLRVWDVGSGQSIRVIQGYEVALYDVDWSPDGSQLISGGGDTMLAIYDVAARIPPRILPGHRMVVFGVSWSPNGRWLASAEWENVIQLWDALLDVHLQLLEHPDDVDNAYFGLAWSPDGQRLASGTTRRGVQVYDMNQGYLLWSAQPFPTWIRHVNWSPDGTKLAGGGDDGVVYLWDARDGRLLREMRGHHSAVSRVVWSPDGRRLASGARGSKGGELFIWNPQSGECLHALPEHARMVYAVAWGPAGSLSEQLLISGDGDGMLRWWDIESGECVIARQAHRGTVQALRRSPDGSKLASCGDDGAIVLWDLGSGEPLQTLRRDRPYERMDITGLKGVTEAQRASLLTLGAVQRN